MDEMILTHLEASGHHEAAAAFRKSSGMPAAAGTPPPPLPSSAGTCPPTMDHFNGEKLMHNAVLTATGGCLRAPMALMAWAWAWAHA